MFTRASIRPAGRPPAAGDGRDRTRPVLVPPRDRRRRQSPPRRLNQRRCPCLAAAVRSRRTSAAPSAANAAAIASPTWPSRPTPVITTVMQAKRWLPSRPRYFAGRAIAARTASRIAVRASSRAAGSRRGRAARCHRSRDAAPSDRPVIVVRDRGCGRRRVRGQGLGRPGARGRRR